MAEFEKSVDPVTRLARALRTEGVSRREFLVAAGVVATASALPRGSVSAAAQESSNVFIYGSGQDISNIDPHTGHDYSIASGQRAVYDSLMRYEGNPPVLKPLLAREVTGNETADEWTIKLAENAIFHDGSPVDAEAVKYSFNRMLAKNRGVAWMFTTIMDESSVEVVDPQTLTVTLTKPFAPFDAVLAWLFVVNPKVVQEHAEGDDEGEEWLKENEAGSGPFTIARWEPGSVYEFTRFPDYWFEVDGVTQPLDGLVWRIIRESSTKRIALEEREISYGDNFTAEDIEALKAEEALVANDASSLSAFAIKMNNQVGPTSDINVRKALSYAFDYEAIIDALLGRGVLMEGPLPVGLEPWHKEDLPVYRFDMELAQAALAASDQYADGGFDLEYVYVTGLAIEEQIGLILLERAAELNINIKMVPLVWPDMVARAEDPQTAPAMMAVYSGTSYIDPDNFLWQAYHSSQAGFWAAASHYNNPDLDKLLEDARSSTDEAERKEMYDQAQLIVVEDAVEIWGMSETENDAWVSALTGPVYDPVMGIDTRGISFTES
jgi:peptide/nickel transport system substrate-binding protein